MTRFIRHNYLYLLIIALSFGVSVTTLAFQSIRLDEAQSIWVATKSVPLILRLDAQDVLTPLYELLLHIWMQIFGSSITAARGLSFLFFLATLPVLYTVAKEATNKKVAMIAITLFSLSPFIMWYSSEARMYSLFAFVTTWNHLFFVRFINSGGRAGKVGYVITTIFGLYTHYFFIFLLLTQLFYLTWRRLIKPDYEMGVKDAIGKPQSRSRRILLIYFSLIIIAGIFFLPWALYFILLGGAANSQPVIPPPTTFNIFQAFINFLFGFQSNAVQSVFVSLWPIFVLTFFVLFTKREEQAEESINYFAFTTFLPVFLIFLGSYLKPIFLTRYLILVTPTLFILIAWMFSGYYKKGARLIFGVLFSVMFVLLVYQNIATTTPTKENYQGVATFLDTHATGSDIIAVSAPFTIYPLEYAYQGNTKIETIPLWDRFAYGAIPAYSQSNFAEQLASYKSQYTNLYVVLSYDQGYENKIKQYLDRHYKRLYLKDFSSDLEVREYKLRYDIAGK